MPKPFGRSAMMAKFGLILLVLVFGALMFCVGLVAPDSIRQPLITLTRPVQGGKGIRTAAAQPAVPSAQASKSATSVPATEAISYQNLLLPSPLPPDGLYALQLGLYPSRESAENWVQRAQDNGLRTLEIPVLEPDGQQSTAVAVGAYASPDEARAARITVSRTLALTQPLPVIRLPAKAVAEQGSSR